MSNNNPSNDTRTTVNLSVPADMKAWLEQKAAESESAVAPIVRAIIRKVMNDEKGA